MVPRKPPAASMRPYGCSLVTWCVGADAAGCESRRDRPLSTHPLSTLATRFPLPITKRRRLSRVANIKTQIKRIKTNEKARQRNAAVRSSLKTSVRKFRSAADAGDASTANAELLKAARQLDKAASKGVIHKNQAANRKSAMAKKAASL